MHDEHQPTAAADTQTAKKPADVPNEPTEAADDGLSIIFTGLALLALGLALIAEDFGWIPKGSWGLYIAILALGAYMITRGLKLFMADLRKHTHDQD